ncbi:MAG: peptidylprolyl isomerase [Bdellovibrionales bacterium]|nr:peptidylprolyl isomerase [Bdellovibrionales bacterium]
MTVTADHVVEFEYTLKNDKGEVIESSVGGPGVFYLHGHGGIIPGLESEMSGMSVGANKSVAVEPAQAYGEYDSALVRKVKKEELKGIPHLEVGLQLEGSDGENFQVFTVTSIEDENVTLDGNHPLAGQKLHFEVKILNVRAATAEELAHGHVHGPDGHHDH